MPLHVPPAPTPALRSVRTALRSSTAVEAARAPARVRAAHGALHPELPLALHEMPCVDGELDRTGTRLTGWRFLLRDAKDTRGERAEQEGAGLAAGAAGADGPDSAPAVAAEAMLTADGWAFADFREGPYVLSTERALREAESLPGAYQPRLLSVPQLYMLTLWLHHDTAADAGEGTPAPSDLLLPLAPAPPGIAAYSPHRVATLLPVLNRRLRTRTLLTGTA